MSSYSQLPGRLNLLVRSGDTLATVVDFDIALTGFTAQSAIFSAVSGIQVGTITTSITDAAAGKVSLGMTATQTAALPSGSYNWTLGWDSAAGHRTALAGVLEVTR